MSTHRRLTAFLAALLASSAAAAAPPALDSLFSNGAVLQRDHPIRISGDAAPREWVRVSLAGASATVRADRDGRWSVELSPLAAGGPHRIEARFASGAQAAADDVLIGDVWLCSGQSNMEYPVRRALNGEAEAQAAADPQLRLMKVSQQLAEAPQQRFAKPPNWRASTPESAAGFSAACYFMVRELRGSEKVPIGAIDASWGGTPIRAWSSEAAVRAAGATADADLAALHRTARASAVRAFGESWGAWWRSQTYDLPGREPWNAAEGLNWKPVPSLAYWDAWGPGWNKWIGAIWAERIVFLTPAEAAQPATLHLSAIDDLDQTFVNGVAVGGLNDPANARSYPVAAGTLKPGENRIVVYVRNAWASGGFAGPAERFRLAFAYGTVKALGEGWRYARIPDSVPAPPAAPWGSSSGVSTIYNGMIAPLGRLSLKGVAWYQGESDVGVPGYDRRLAALMSSWRGQVRNPQLPFLMVALAGFGKPASQPVDSGWAALIDAQRRAAMADPRAALVAATDLGERDDIHPPNKQEVGRRLALAARRLAYGKADIAAGIVPIAAARSGSQVHIGIAGTGAALQSLSGTPIGFELCAETQDSCRYANARLAASAPVVVVQLDGKPATRVRYGWADYPILNVTDDGLLPLPPFELPIKN
jgi:sialate O-acetylesterase